MKNLYGLLVLGAALAPAYPQQQERAVREYSTPRGPAADALGRLNLMQAWKIRVPTEGSRDGILSLQLAPGLKTTGYQVFVQTLRGYLLALDPETGVTQWRAFLGRPYELGRPVAFNSKYVVALRGERMYLLDRRTGDTYPYAPDPDSGKLLYGYKLHSVPSAPPSMDEEAVFVPFGTQIYAYLLPELSAEAPARENEPTPKKVVASAPPRFIWGTPTDTTDVLQPAILTAGFLGLIANDGSYVAGTKFDFDKVTRAHLRLDGDVTVPAGGYGDVAYIATHEGNLYAMLVSGRVLWRLVTGSPILFRPQVTDDDVFVTSERGGLVRVNRRDRQVRAAGRDRIYFGGDIVWRNGEARRFLSTNDRFVYATDRLGRLLVLDYDRGTLLARLDTMEWKFPVSNPWSDRFFLAAHDGQVLCLHHRDSKTPVITKKVELIKPEEKKGEKKDEAADEEPKDVKPPADKKGDKMPAEKPPAPQGEKEQGAIRLPEGDRPAVCRLDRTPARQRFGVWNRPENHL